MVETLDRWFKQRWRGRQENRQSARYVPNLVRQCGKALRIGSIQRDIRQPLQKCVNQALRLAVIGQKFAQCRACHIAECIIGKCATRSAENTQVRINQAIGMQRI